MLKKLYVGNRTGGTEGKANIVIQVIDERS